MRRFISVLLLLVSSPVFSAATTTKVWELLADYDGGVPYAVKFNEPIPGGPVSLRPDFRYDYSQDPEEIAASSPWFWTKSPAATKRTFVPLSVLPGLFVCEPAVVSVGNRIYLIGGCTGGNSSGVAAQTQAKVWISDVVGGAMQGWRLASWEYGQTQNAPAGIPISETRAVAVGNRIYVAGGSTLNCGSPVITGGLQATAAVYSAPVNPATGDVGPWVKEPTLLKSVVTHGFVYAGGALFTMGGREQLGPFTWAAHPWVQKAEIKPDGHLDNWEAMIQIPDGVPLFGCTGSSGQGWEQIGSFAVGRMIGFMGGMMVNSVIGTCPFFYGGYYTYLDDNNRLIPWTALGIGKGRPGSYPQIYNGAFISAGGIYNGTPVPDVVHNPVGGEFGVERDFSYGYDGTSLRPNYGKLDLEGIASSYRFNVSAFPAPATMVNNSIFMVGIGGPGSTYSYEIYRTVLKAASTYVDAAYYISKPYDTGRNHQLMNIKWTFKKNGTGAVGNPDDWAMVRYRLADENMAWGSWSPRIPEAGNMPLAPGTYTYTHLQPDGSETPRSSQLWMTVNKSTFRYIQFEVNLYKNSNTLHLPEFNRFEIEFGDPPPDNPVSKLPEIYPVPADKTVNIRFKVIPDGAEVKVRLFNVAGEPVSEENFVYPDGGARTVTLAVDKFANGIYIAVINADCIKDGKGGLLDGQDRKTKATAKVVIRHKK